jgi:hypothetical protein
MTRKNTFARDNPWYYGYKRGGGNEAFFSKQTPTERTHGDKYIIVTGPFRTRDEAVRSMVRWYHPPFTEVRRGKIIKISGPFGNPPREGNLKDFARSLGLYVATWAPGDGVTRYRFFTQPLRYDQGDGLYTALGLKEAWCFVRGYAAKARARENPRRIYEVIVGNIGTVEPNPEGYIGPAEVIHLRRVAKRVGATVRWLPDGKVRVSFKSGRILEARRSDDVSEIIRAIESGEISNPVRPSRGRFLRARVADPNKNPLLQTVLNPPKNPVSARIPFRDGQKIPIERARAWVQKLGDPELMRQFKEAERLQTTANKKPRFVIWKTLPIGSPKEIEMLTAFAHYGDSPETIYKPPKGSRKGRHMYRHEWGEEAGRPRPVPILAAPSGKAIIKVMGPGQKIWDWMRG